MINNNVMYSNNTDQNDPVASLFTYYALNPKTLAAVAVGENPPLGGKTLPQELLTLILFTITEPKDLVRAKSVCRRWYYILNDDLSWNQQLRILPKSLVEFSKRAFPNYTNQEHYIYCHRTYLGLVDSLLPRNTYHFVKGWGTLPAKRIHNAELAEMNALVERGWLHNQSPIEEQHEPSGLQNLDGMREQIRQILPAMIQGLPEQLQQHNTEIANRKRDGLAPESCDELENATVTYGRPPDNRADIDYLLIRPTSFGATAQELALVAPTPFFSDETIVILQDRTVPISVKIAAVERSLTELQVPGMVALSTWSPQEKFSFCLMHALMSYYRTYHSYINAHYSLNMNFNNGEAPFLIAMLLASGADVNTTPRKTLISLSPRLLMIPGTYGALRHADLDTTALENSQAFERVLRASTSDRERQKLAECRINTRLLQNFGA